MRDSRNLLQIQFQRLADQQLIQPPILAQDERVIQARHQQDVVHAKWHQLFEAFEQPLRIEFRARALSPAPLLDLLKNTGWNLPPRIVSAYW